MCIRSLMLKIFAEVSGSTIDNKTCQKRPTEDNNTSQKRPTTEANRRKVRRRSLDTISCHIVRRRLPRKPVFFGSVLICSVYDARMRERARACILPE